MDQFVTIAREIDCATDDRDVSRIQAAIDEIDRLLECSDLDNPLLHYYRANAFSALRILSQNWDEEQFGWQQPTFSEEILSLRRATRCSNFGDLDHIRKCQIWTNLANALNFIGRPIDGKRCSDPT